MFNKGDVVQLKFIGESMKVGDVIEYDERWGVIYKIDGSHAHFRIQTDISSTFDYSPQAVHICCEIDLLEYYDNNLLQHIKYKIYRFFESAYLSDTANLIFLIMTLFGGGVIIYIIINLILRWIL